MYQRRAFLVMQYGAAVAIAPLFCLLYAHLSGYRADDPFWLLKEGRSLFFLSIFYPVIEEVTFRGVIQDAMTALTKQRFLFFRLSFANLFTSLLFVMMHLVYHELLWAAAVFFPSLLLGYFKERFGYLYPSILLHMYYNFTFFSLIGN
jgi:membrane protease YdiL (CAAX protease family)